MSARAVELNLLPKEIWEKGILGQLFHWVLFAGRYVVVFTELLVISAFLYRFGLDRALTDLRASVKEKQATINAFGDVEAVFRRTQTQLATIKQASGEPRIFNILELLGQIVPADTVLNNVSLSQTQAIIEGTVASQTSLATLLNQAQSRPEFADVILENVKSSFDKSGSIEFNLTLIFKTT